MSVTPLATPKDIEDIIGRDLDEAEKKRADAILGKLSELFRAESQQHFTPGISHVERKVNGGKVYLPQRPVNDVLEVTDTKGRTIDWAIWGQWLTVGAGSSRMVRVHYSHGSDEVPPLVVSTIADAARQVLQISPAAVAGITQDSETTGPFTGATTYATWAVGGATRLSPEDIKVARSFRVRTGNIWVAE